MSKKPAEVRQRGRQIAELRRTVPGITQQQIADRLGMSRSNVAHYERGAVKATVGLFTPIPHGAQVIKCW